MKWLCNRKIATSKETYTKPLTLTQVCVCACGSVCVSMRSAYMSVVNFLCMRVSVCVYVYCVYVRLCVLCIMYVHICL